MEVVIAAVIFLENHRAGNDTDDIRYSRGDILEKSPRR